METNSCTATKILKYFKMSSHNNNAVANSWDTTASKINVTPKGFTCPFRSYSILAVANLLAHNNKSQICYCGQISLQSAAVNCNFCDNLTPLGVPFILLAMVNVDGWRQNCRCWEIKIMFQGYRRTIFWEIHFKENIQIMRF